MGKFFGAILIILLSLLPLTYAQTTASPTYPSANQNVTIKRLTTFVSGYLTFAQYQTIINRLSYDLYSGMTFDAIKADATTTITATLTSAQYSAILMKGTTLIFSLGAAGITTALNNLMTVISNNCTPFFNQLVVYVAKMKAQGMKEKGIAKNGYRIVNSFASKKRIKTIFTRVSLKFTAAQWKSLVSALGSFINFSKNGF